MNNSRKTKRDNNSIINRDNNNIKIGEIIYGNRIIILISSKNMNKSKRENGKGNKKC